MVDRNSKVESKFKADFIANYLKLQNNAMFDSKAVREESQRRKLQQDLNSTPLTKPRANSTSVSFAMQTF